MWARCLLNVSHQIRGHFGGLKKFRNYVTSEIRSRYGNFFKRKA